MSWAGHVARIGVRRGIYRDLVRKPESKRPHGRPRRRWKCNSKMALHKVGYEGVDWINVAQEKYKWRALVNTEMNIRVP
jgi:hypothetical protein